MAVRKPAAKIGVRRRPSRKKNPYLKVAVIAFIILLLAAICYHYRDGLAYYFGFKSDKASRNAAAEKRLADLRNIQVLVRHDGMAVGFDVSEYQGDIDWDQADSIDAYPLQFVFIRATAGNDKVDGKFKQNWAAARNQDLVRGAYHYYRPNENSIEQAQNFINTVALKEGDLPPVLDIEQLPEEQSIDSLKIGLKRWLTKVENHYKVRPIIYSGEKYYDDFLKDAFSEYTFWIANYNFFVDSIADDWLIWQFTEKGTVPGIDGDVDINIYNGTFEQMQQLRVKK